MSDRGTDGNVTATGRTRKRAAEACTFCRRRKVCHHLVNRENGKTDPTRSNAVPRGRPAQAAKRME
jgi:hypothetical protein